jgi:putative hydrolase of the HAD superfamily
MSDVRATLPNPQAIRAVFFDAGYTLLAPHPSIVEIAVTALAGRGLMVDASAIAARLPEAEEALRRAWSDDRWTWADDRAIGQVWMDYYVQLLAPLLADLGEEEIADAVAAVVHAFDHAASYALYSDVEPTLRALKGRGFTLGVISDWGIGLGLILRHHDLVQYFDFAVISAAVRLAKPDPALFETALRRADAIPDYAVHIGDSYVLDVLGARAAGIAPVLIDRQRKHDAGDVDCPVVHDLYGLLDLLEVPRPPEALAAAPADGEG